MPGERGQVVPSLRNTHETMGVVKVVSQAGRVVGTMTLGIFVALIPLGTVAGGSDAPAKVKGVISVRTVVDQRHDPAGVHFSTCKLYETKPETIVAKGTFAVPFPYSGGTISVFPFNPAHPGGGGFGKSLPMTHKGARTWQATFHLYGNWKPTICELAISAPQSN